MRPLRTASRLLASSALAAVVALGLGASAALAAPAEPGRYEIGDEWCFVDYGGTTYCTETDGFVQYVVTPDGDEIGLIKFQEHVVIYEDGVVVGEYTTLSMDQSRFVDGALVVDQVIEHTKAEFGDQRCIITTVFRIADYELVVDHSIAPHCS